MPWLGWGRVRMLRLNGVDVPITSGRMTFVQEPLAVTPRRGTWQVDAELAVPWTLRVGRYTVEAELEPQGVLVGPGRLTWTAGLSFRIQSDGPWTGVEEW